MKHLIGNVLYGFDHDVMMWVADRVPGFQPSTGAKALGVVRDGKIIAGVVYDQWNGVHVLASIAADTPGWASKSSLFHLFSYPFETLGCEAISVLVPSSNLQSLNLATKLGFEPEAIVTFAAHDGSSLIVMKMFREKCRWIGHGQKGRERTEGA